MYDKLIEERNKEKDICAGSLAAACVGVEKMLEKLEESNIKHKPKKTDIDEVCNELKNLTNHDDIKQITEKIKKYTDKNKITQGHIIIIKQEIDNLKDQEDGIKYGIPNDINTDLDYYIQELLGQNNNL